MAGTSSSSVELISREKEQAGEEKEHYCSECREKILPWKRDLYEERTNLGASFGNNEYKQNLHKDLLEFLECAKWCRFCSYLCSLFNEQWLRNQIHGFTSGDNAFVEIGFDSYQSRCDSFGTFEVVQMRVILQFVPLTDFHLPLENRVFEPKIEERRFNVCTAAGKPFSHPLWKAKDLVLFPERAAAIQDWLQVCKDEHPDCRRMSDFNGTQAARILHVHRSEIGRVLVKLVPMSLVTERNCEYVVLSHVWGGVEIICKTTRHNISEYETKGIELDSLPRTFKEAILLTLDLDLQYIWIDSLCIIQDDPEDWQDEAAKMATVFREAILTLSATTSSNCFGGCGYSDALQPASHFEGTVLPFAARDTSLASWDNPFKRIVKGPVHQRAWIFQEKLLSRRIVHTTNEQFVWQCASLVQSEDRCYKQDWRMDSYSELGLLDSHVQEGVEGDAQLKTQEVKSFFWDMRWWTWVHDYMSRKLSHPSDQYAAFAGAVQLFREMTGDEPVAGLWRRHLPLHLAWKVFQGSMGIDHLPTRGTRRPSWTWMSYPQDNAVSVHNSEIDQSDLLANRKFICAEIIDIQIQWSGKSWTSTPAGSIKIRSRVDWLSSRTGYGDFVDVSWAFDPDIDPSICTEAQRGGAFQVLALSARFDELLFKASYVCVEYLIIKPTEDAEVGEFIRIGRARRLYQCDSDDFPSWQTPGTTMDITLV